MANPLRQMMIRACRLNHTFGMVRDGGTRAHQGWDLAAGVGTPVYAVRAGRVAEVQPRDVGDYGISLTLAFTHGPLTLYAFYAHLGSVAVERDAQVAEGDLLGYTGRTGNASRIPLGESHLHFEVRTAARPGRGLEGRVDPGEVLGWAAYSTPRERVTW